MARKRYEPEEYSGMSGDQLRRLKELEKENERLRRAVSDWTLDKQILAEAARGNFWPPRAAPAGCWGSTARPSAVSRADVTTRIAWSQT